MRSVGLKILKNKLSEYVRIAAAGETVLVMDRDRVVAEIVPASPGRNALLADPMLAEAVRQGLITLPARAAIGPPPRGEPITNHDTLMREIEADREDR